MEITRRHFLASAAATCGLAASHARQPLGLVAYSFGIHLSQNASRRDPFAFLEHCRKAGAAGVQMSLGTRDADYSSRLRRKVEEQDMYLEGIVSLPKIAADVGRFESECRTAKAAGVRVARTALLSGRRYETFETAAAFKAWEEQAWKSLVLAEPVLARSGLKLAVENHKDWRAAELVDRLKKLDSRHVGACVDTGNNLALLEDPIEVVEALAPRAFTSHIKDMAVAEHAEGFLLAETALGTGILDMPRIVRTLRTANPKIALNLEMITRDPLVVPCLGPKYWATSDSVPARRLAETLALVRRTGSKPPRMSGLSDAERAERESENVAQCLAFGNRLG